MEFKLWIVHHKDQALVFSSINKQEKVLNH